MQKQISYNNAVYAVKHPDANTVHSLSASGYFFDATSDFP